MLDAKVTHEHMLAICPRLPSDYTDHGGTVVRWEAENEAYPDCSCGCRWADWLEPPFSADRCVSGRPDGPRRGLLTFEHMTGKDCFEAEERSDPERISNT